MADSKSTSGIGVGGLLLVAFILLKILKIAPVASWSWWWVLSPLWIPLGVGLICIIAYFIIFLTKD